MSVSNAIHIGTSGWHYDHWAGPFYPQDLPQEDYLSYYVQHFQTVEINNSFYQLPEVETFQHWRQAAPQGFQFAVKASRYITHMKKLKDPQEPVAHFLSRVEHLAHRLGPVLFQLPPRWRFNGQRLRQFLRSLPPGFRYTMEFRDPSWFCEEAYAALSEYGVAFCIYHLAGRLSPKQMTADFVYVRLHGPADAAYQGCYSAQELSGWAGAFSTWSRQGRDIYCYFDNDQAGYAAQNAARLQEMMRG